MAEMEEDEKEVQSLLQMQECMLDNVLDCNCNFWIYGVSFSWEI